MKPTLLRLHRWMTLLFALPWIVIIATGLILSFEPILMDRDFTGQSIPPGRVEAAIATHDPDGKAATLHVRAYDRMIFLIEGRGVPPLRIDLETGERIHPDAILLSDFFTASRRLHEHLLLDLKWVVDASTIAMLVSIVFGLLMGLPRFRNTLGGWHRMTAWTSAPLLILSPLTGLAIAYGIHFTGPPAAVTEPAPSLAQAVQVVAARHDLASLYWIRPMGGALRARIYDGGQARVFTVTRDGLVAGPQSWPRVLHEGVWAGAWSGLLNVVTSLVLIGLLVTGLVVWLRRKRARWALRRGRSAVPV